MMPGRAFRVFGLTLFATVLLALYATVLLALYRKDSATVEQALEVRNFLVGLCEAEGRYPTEREFETRYGRLLEDDWYYWPTADLAQATFQYPMTLPLGRAPGESKLSEFFPIIYAYAVRDPCDGSAHDVGRDGEHLESNVAMAAAFDPPLGPEWTFGPLYRQALDDDWELWATSATNAEAPSEAWEEKRAVFLVYRRRKMIYRALDRGRETMRGCVPTRFVASLPRITYYRSRPDGSPCPTHDYFADLPADSYMDSYSCGIDPECTIYQ